MSVHELRWSDTDNDNTGHWEIQESIGNWKKLDKVALQPGTWDFKVVEKYGVDYTPIYYVTSASGTSTNAQTLAFGTAGDDREFSLTLSAASPTYIRALKLLSDDPTFKVTWTKDKGTNMTQQGTGDLQWLAASNSWQYQGDSGTWLALPADCELSDAVDPGSEAKLHVYSTDDDENVAAVYQTGGPTLNDFAILDSRTTDHIFTLSSGTGTETWSTNIYQTLNDKQQFLLQSS